LNENSSSSDQGSQSNGQNTSQSIHANSEPDMKYDETIENIDYDSLEENTDSQTIEDTNHLRERPPTRSENESLLDNDDFLELMEDLHDIQ
jgi:hypothetical protein